MGYESLRRATSQSHDKHYYTDVETAAFLCISASTLRRWRLTGKGPRWIKIGWSVRYARTDLEVWLDSRPSGGGAAGESAMTAESLARALKARRVGTQSMACCPAHDDRNPSLAISQADCGVLVHCFAGCSQRDVIEALRARGLWSSDRIQHRRIVAEYTYTDERGQMLYQVVRYVPKDFRPRYPDGQGGWVYRKHPRQVLYHLPEVIEAAIVFIVEGERDAESLRDHGFVATTHAGGANAPWLPSYTQTLAGREVILIPDNDAPGRQRGLTIARALAGRAARLVVFEVEGAKDVTEWFERGHSEIELIEHVESGLVLG